MTVTLLNKVLSVILAGSIVFIMASGKAGNSTNASMTKMDSGVVNSLLDTTALINPDSLIAGLSMGENVMGDKVTQVTKTVTGLKEQVKVLENKVVQLTNENTTLKKVLDAAGVDVGSDFKLLPISQEDRK